MIAPGQSLLPNPSLDAASVRLSVAPMMDWTDSHCRVFHRSLAPHARLYTEMVHANAVIHGERARLLALDPVEHPVALQLGGSEPNSASTRSISTAAARPTGSRPGASARA